jgi:tryptophan synthase alpha subunit
MTTARAAGLRQIYLAAPTTAEARLAELCAQAEGFLYYVSFAGVTGADRLDLAPVRARVAAIKARSKVPVAVGFGVRDTASAVTIAQFADAVVIGSALVAHLRTAPTLAREELPDPCRVAQRAETTNPNTRGAGCRAGPADRYRRRIHTVEN